MKSLFWKVFLIIWVASITEVILASVMVNWDVRQRVSQCEVSERFTQLAEFVIDRYESGLETDNPGDQQQAADGLPPNQPDGDGDGRLRPGRQILVIDDLATGEKLFGTEFPEEPGSWIQWEMISASGGEYLVSVLNPTVNEFDLLNLFTPFRTLVTLIVTALFSGFFTLLLIAPMKGLRAHVERIGSGIFDHTMERKLLNRGDELGDLARAIDDMANRIEVLLDSRQRLLYDVSHELRAPLARLQFASQMASEKAEESGVSAAIFERLQNETDLLNRLISELLNLSKDETDLDELVSVQFDELIQKQIDNVLFNHPERAINANLAAAAAPISIRPMLFQRIMHNILENAMKYAPEDKPVEISVHETENGWSIRIEDSGPGIAEEALETVFQPFNRLDSDPTKGFGLGLSIAQRAITALGGNISLSNRATGGLRVELTLPR